MKLRDVISITLGLGLVAIYLVILTGLVRLHAPVCQENPSFFLKGSVYDCAR